MTMTGKILQPSPWHHAVIQNEPVSMTGWGLAILLSGAMWAALALALLR